MEDVRNLAILAVVAIIIAGGFSYYALDGVDITPQVAQVSTTMTSVSCAGLSSDITKIYNVTDFAKIQKDIKNGIRDKHYILCNGLNLGGSDDYVPENAWFEGTFDGNGKKLINFHTNPSSNRNNQGLFALIGERGVVKNLILETPNVVNPSSVSVGLIAGENKGAIQNIEIRNKVPWVWIKVRGKENVGGIAGKNHSTGVIRNIKIPEGVYLSVEGITRYAGGIAGTNAGTIGNITSMGTYSVTVPTLAGGIAGYNTGTISDTQTYTYVIATNKKAGGIAGEIGGGLIEYSRSGREVRGGDLTGGIVGAYSGGKIHGSYSDSVLKDTDDINNDLKVAGIAGGVSSNSNFTYVAYNNVKRICSGCTAIDNLAYGEAPWTCSAKSFPLPLAKPDMCAGGGSSSDDMMSSDDYSSTVTLKAGTSLEKQEVYCRGDCDGVGTYICDKNTKQWKEVENTCKERSACPAGQQRTAPGCGKASFPAAAHGTPYIGQCPGGCDGIVEARCKYGEWVGNFMCGVPLVPPCSEACPPNNYSQALKFPSCSCDIYPEKSSSCPLHKGFYTFYYYYDAVNQQMWDLTYKDTGDCYTPDGKKLAPLRVNRGYLDWCNLEANSFFNGIDFNYQDLTYNPCACEALGSGCNENVVKQVYNYAMEPRLTITSSMLGAGRTSFLGDVDVGPARTFYQVWLSVDMIKDAINAIKDLYDSGWLQDLFTSNDIVEVQTNTSAKGNSYTYWLDNWNGPPADSSPDFLNIEQAPFNGSGSKNLIIPIVHSHNADIYDPLNAFVRHHVMQQINDNPGDFSQYKNIFFMDVGHDYQQKASITGDHLGALANMYIDQKDDIAAISYSQGTFVWHSMMDKILSFGPREGEIKTLYLDPPIWDHITVPGTSWKIPAPFLDELIIAGAWQVPFKGTIDAGLFEVNLEILNIGADYGHNQKALRDSCAAHDCSILYFDFGHSFLRYPNEMSGFDQQRAGNHIKLMVGSSGDN